ncbi:MAG: hypothetical protein P8M68_02600 [Aquiluna sp.]|nr:hypothetical protein [Aquiluna sp.]
MTDKPEFWFNTKSNQVEIGPQSLSLDRIGPFESSEEAKKGLEIVAQRARQLREEDQKEWDN